MTSPASAAIIVNPKMRSSVATTKAFMKPSVYSMASVLKNLAHRKHGEAMGEKFPRYWVL
jgi:hypothetical protein